MKKIILSFTILGASILSAQFKININVPNNFENKSVLIYTLNGSKDVLLGHANKKNGQWVLNVPTDYKGIMKAYFPTSGKSVNFISENKDISFTVKTNGNDILGQEFSDQANIMWRKAIVNHQRQETILPALTQIKQLYGDGSDFDIALSKEISEIEKSKTISFSQFPFISYYLKNSKYSTPTGQGKPKFTSAEYADFLINTGEMLETSSLLGSVVLNYLGTLSQQSFEKEIDNLLEKADVKTNRGQNILSELITLFGTYGLKEQQEKYYKLASNLTCEINSNLKDNIAAIKRTSVGAIFPNYTFSSKVKNTKAKSIKNIKASKKVVFFWSSTCPHCLSELPIILENYKQLKSKNIEIIGLSMDSDAKNYTEKSSALPWINDAELKGWNSSYAEKYNVKATPTYYVLDSNDKIIDKPNNFSEFLASISSK